MLDLRPPFFRCLSLELLPLAVWSESPPQLDPLEWVGLSFSGESGVDPAAGCGLNAGMVFTLEPFFWNKCIDQTTA